jgi:lysophospholipase L1-like esterase
MNFSRKTAWTLACLLGGVVALEYIPAMQNYRVLDWDSAQQVMDFHPSKSGPAALRPIEEAEIRLKPGKAFQGTAPHADSGAATPKSGERGVAPLTDDSNSLLPFYAAMERIEQKKEGSTVRVAHYGDSPTTADLITADVRGLLQRQFGDAGHGFYLLAKPWAWYGHKGVDSDSSGWDIAASNLTKNRDGLYGYGGVSFQGGAGSKARFRLRDEGYKTVEVAYWKKPGGGSFVVEACGENLGETSTAAETPEAGFIEYRLPEKCREVNVRGTSAGLRLFGLQFRRDEPGFIYDSLGLNGAYISVLAKFQGEQHWTGQLQHYRPDLVVINYGTNESVYAAFVDTVFEKELKESIRRIKTALPGGSILVMSPMDRGERSASGQIETVPALARLVEVERRVAQQEGVAFFNTFQAMGGQGTMGKWYAAEPRLVGADFIHPMPGGAKIIGELLFKAVMDGYNRYKTEKSSTAKNVAASVPGAN